MRDAVALTGATGFIGSALCDALVAARYPVRALTRRPQPPRPGIVWVPGDLTRFTALTALVEGAHSVIHCAGVVRGRSAVEFQQVNVQGTQALLNVIRARTPPPRLLFLSSLAARSPELSWYARSKFDAEALIRTRAGDVPWTILRPPAVYGPGDREMRPLFEWLLRGLLPAPQPRGSRFSLLHVDDLAGAVLAWLNRPQGDSDSFELCDGTPGGYDAEALAQQTRTHLNRKVRLLPVPPWLLRLAAGTNLALAWLGLGTPMLTPGKVRELIHSDWIADSSRFARATGWQPRIRFADALQSNRLFFT